MNESVVILCLVSATSFMGGMWLVSIVIYLANSFRDGAIGQNNRVDFVDFYEDSNEPKSDSL